jgi:fibronectin type 3 domain-containing protein
VKADLIKSTVKWGGLEPKGDVTTEGTGGGVKITINLGGQEHAATVIDAEPIEETKAIEDSQ